MTAIKCPKCRVENPDSKKFCGECGTSLDRERTDISAFVTKTLETSPEGFNTSSIFADRYQIIEELGVGGMGRVYKVLDKEIEAKIALKLINPEIAADKKTIERFRNELKLAREISHKNVCRMYHLGRHEGSYYITMEFVDGEDLKSTIRRVGPIGAGKAITIAKQVCEGLAEAHRRGVVHRDLKPNNIMLDKEGNAKIMDFGIARSMKAKGITGVGVMIGTPEYMSPEQAEARDADHRSDIYSFGVILYEMLTGQLPFEGDTPLSIAMKHKSEPPTDPRELNPQIPEDLSHLILKCMEKEKQARYQSADEVLDELMTIEKRMPITTREVKKAKTITSKEITVSFSIRKLVFPVLPLALAVIVVGLILWKPWSKKESLPLSQEKPFIAVLPFKDRSPQKDQEYFCDGMTEQIITNLTRIPELKVIARTSVMAYKNSQKDVRQISRELGVKYVLEGSIRRSGSQLRVSASLIDAEKGINIWANDYDRKWQDTIEIQDDVSKSIAKALKISLSERTSKVIKAGYPRNVEAYDLYLKARHYVETRYLTTRDDRDFQHALELAKQAVEIDPEFALGYIGIAYLYENRWIITNDPHDLELEKQYIRKGYELNPELPESNAALTMIYIREGDYDKAFSHIQSAREINPDSWDVQVILGNFYGYIGLFHQSIRSFSSAYELNPLNIFGVGNLGGMLIQVGNYKQALHYIEKVSQLQPNYIWNLTNYALLLVAKKEYEKAGDILDQIESQPAGVAPHLPVVKALYYAAAGERKKALNMNKSGIVLAFLGMKDEALDFIDHTTEKETGLYNFFYTYLSLVNLPFYDSLRGEPQFQEIVQREKEKYEQRLKKYAL